MSSMKTQRIFKLNNDTRNDPAALKRGPQWVLLCYFSLIMRRWVFLWLLLYVKALLLLQRSACQPALRPKESYRLLLILHVTLRLCGSLPRQRCKNIYVCKDSPLWACINDFSTNGSWKHTDFWYAHTDSRYAFANNFATTIL